MLPQVREVRLLDEEFTAYKHSYACWGPLFYQHPIPDEEGGAFTFILFKKRVRGTYCLMFPMCIIWTIRPIILSAEEQVKYAANDDVGLFVPIAANCSWRKGTIQSIHYGGMYITPLLMMKWPSPSATRFYRAFFIKIGQRN